MPCGGAGVIALECARRLSERHHEVTYVYGANEDKEWTEGKLHFVTLSAAKKGHLPWHTYWHPSAVRSLERFLCDLNPDVVFMHNIQDKSFSLGVLRIARIWRTFWMLHDQWHLCIWSYPHPYSCRGFESGCRRCRALPGLAPLVRLAQDTVFSHIPVEVIVPSQWLYDQLDFCGLREKPRHLVPYGIDTNFFKPIANAHVLSEKHLALNIHKGKRLLLFIGDMRDKRKGWDIAVEVLRRVKKKNDVNLLFVGEPPSSGVTENGVQFTGQIDHSLMPLLYSAADLLLFPTRADNLPVVILEALACETPVVASSVGGIPEMISNGKNGFLVGQGDVLQYAKHVDKILDNKERAKRMGAAGRKVVLDRFRVEDMIKSVENLFLSSFD
jgi:glycosyltransferase involved in cell wall biosynthesis